MPAMIVGRKPVIEALKAGSSLDKIFLLSGIQGKPIEEIRSLARQRNVPVAEFNRQQFRELAKDQMTQGVVGILQPRHKYADVELILSAATERQQRPFILICDEIEDPHNLGALIRTAECAGVHGVIVPKHHSAPVNATVTKTSAGATEHLPIAEVTNIVSTIEELKQKSFWIVGLDGAGDKRYNEVDYTSPVAVVVGNEGKGIRRLVREHCDFLVKIPLLGRIESLNASVAGALVMYEVVKQRSVGHTEAANTPGGGS
ncbi:MAG: 23S rRNA (guanosine(2251)-2'-O)-methyltransferase RlmB [Ignavibacteriae bacterium]|nr:23S rRNA (guanosine(2251)-2'-O)-methyltransferase RlmB [Ignavibacteriota bacterium]